MDESRSSEGSGILDGRYVVYPNGEGLHSLYQDGKKLHVGSLKMCRNFAQQNEKQKREE